MSAMDKLKNAAEKVEGRAKQAVGGATGDSDLQAEGKTDEKSGQIKDVGEKVKDVFN